MNHSSKNNTPSSSPRKVSAVIVSDLLTTIKFDDAQLKEQEEIAEIISEILYETSDKDAFGGNIQDEAQNPILTPYIKSINDLYPIVHSENGGLIQLSPDVVLDLAPHIYYKVMARGGKPHTKFCCIMINLDAASRGVPHLMIAKPRGKSISAKNNSITDNKVRGL